MKLSVTFKVADQSQALALASAMQAVSLGALQDTEKARALAAVLYGVPVIGVTTK